MEPRFQQRKDQLLADCQVPPAPFRGAVRRLEAFAQPFVASLPSPESRRYTAHLPRRAALRPRAQERRVHRLPHDRERQALQASSAVAVGPRAPARRAGPPGRRRDGPARRRAGLRPLGLPQEGHRVGRRAAAVVRPARQGRELPGRRLPRLRLRRRARPGRLPALPAQGVGQGPEDAGSGAGCPRRSASAPGTSWPWRCSTSAAAALPHGWVAGDDEMGRSSWFRQQLAARQRALPAGRAVEHDGPRPGGRAAAVRRATAAGPRPPFRGVRAWCEALAGRGVDPADGPRRREGAAGGRGRGAARGGEGGARVVGRRGDRWWWSGTRTEAS